MDTKYQELQQPEAIYYIVKSRQSKLFMSLSTPRPLATDS